MHHRILYWAASCLLSTAVALSANQLSADTRAVYTDSGQSIFKVDVPDFWSLRTGGIREIVDPETSELRDVSRVFGLTPNAHQGVWVGLISPHGVSNLNGARDYLQDIGPFLVQDAVLEGPKSRRIGGYPARTVAGKGRRDGKRIDFTAVTIDLPNNRVAIAVIIFEAGADSQLVGDINRMLSSIRVAR